MSDWTWIGYTRAELVEEAQKQANSTAADCIWFVINTRDTEERPEETL